jgi:hypothetical protein
LSYQLEGAACPIVDEIIRAHREIPSFPGTLDVDGLLVQVPGGQTIALAAP